MISEINANPIKMNVGVCRSDFLKQIEAAIPFPSVPTIQINIE